MNGNLKNIIERALIEGGGGEIKSHHLHFVSRENSDPTPPSSSTMPDLPMDLGEATRWAELRVVEQVMERVDGNVSEVARLLGTSRNKIYRIISEKKED